MDQLEEFPFVIGQKVEAKSNIKGYRGAWFRCEIKDIHLRRGEIWCAMQYLDFPDEKVSSTKAYQQDLTGKKRRLLMLRPSFPSVSRKVDDTVQTDGTGALVIINGDWQVGDPVDWWSDGCFWAGKITAVLNKDSVQVELPSSPIGEGGSYEAVVKDIRPSLDWSVEQHWTVPCMKVYSNNRLGAFCINGASTGSTGSTDSFEAEKRAHIFVARQEPLMNTFATQPKFLKDDETHTKRKACFLESEHIFETGDMQNVAGCNKHQKFGEMADVIAQGTSFTVSTPPLMGELRNSSAIDSLSRLTRNFSSHVDYQMPKSQKTGIENNIALRSTSPMHDKCFQKDRLECISRECIGEQLMDFNFPEARHQKEKEGEGKLAEQTGHTRTSRLRELESFPWQVSEHKTGRHQASNCELHMLSRQENTEAMNLERNFSFSKLDRRYASPSICNQHAGAVSDKSIDTLVQEGKCLDLDEGSISSSIMALEELVSRAVWLKGVLQLGLKGWSQERTKKKWKLCEGESDDTILEHGNVTQPKNNLKQETELKRMDQNSERALLDTIQNPEDLGEKEMYLLTDSSRQASLLQESKEVNTNSCNTRGLLVESSDVGSYQARLVETDHLHTNSCTTESHSKEIEGCQLIFPKDSLKTEVESVGVLACKENFPADMCCSEEWLHSVQEKQGMSGLVSRARVKESSHEGTECMIYDPANKHWACLEDGRFKVTSQPLA